MDRIGSPQERLKADQRRELPNGDSQKGAVGILAKPQRSETRGIVESKHVVNGAIRFLGEHLFADSAFDEHLSPTIRSAILNGAKQHLAMLGAGVELQGRGINGESVRPVQPFRRILKRNCRPTVRSVQPAHQKSLSLPFDVNFPTHLRGRRMR